MKKTFSIIMLSLLALCLILPLSAQEQDSTDVMVSRQMELYGISEDNTLQEVAEFVNLSIEDLRLKFKLNPRDTRLAQRKLKALRLDPEKVILFRDNQLYNYDHNYTVHEISKKLNIPIKKLLEYLKLNVQDKSNYDKTLLELHFTPEDIDKINKDFLEHKSEFGAILTLLGMLVVFSALAITALVISQMVHFNPKKKPVVSAPASVQTPIGTVNTSKSEDMSSAAIIAVITAIHMRMQELEEESKLMLTWKRANVSMWQATGKVQFPNSQFNQFRK